jgi:hypothetical protein
MSQAGVAAVGVPLMSASSGFFAAHPIQSCAKHKSATIDNFVFMLSSQPRYVRTRSDALII